MEPQVHFEAGSSGPLAKSAKWYSGRVKAERECRKGARSQSQIKSAAAAHTNRSREQIVLFWSASVCARLEFHPQMESAPLAPNNVAAGAIDFGCGGALEIRAAVCKPNAAHFLLRGCIEMCDGVSVGHMAPQVRRVHVCLRREPILIS